MIKFVDVYFDIPDEDGYSIIKSLYDVDITNEQAVKDALSNDVYYENDLKHIKNITELTKEEFIKLADIADKPSASLQGIVWSMIEDEEDYDWIEENIGDDFDAALQHILEFEGDEARKYLLENGADEEELNVLGIE